MRIGRVSAPAGECIKLAIRPYDGVQAKAAGVGKITCNAFAPVGAEHQQIAVAGERTRFKRTGELGATS